MLTDKFTQAKFCMLQTAIEHRREAERAGQYALVLRMGLEGVERRLLARDGVVDEREAAGARPRVSLLLPLRQLVPGLCAPPPPRAGILPGRLPQEEATLLLPSALTAVGGTLGA
jgi:hypothetical protein